MRKTHTFIKISFIVLTLIAASLVSSAQKIVNESGNIHKNLAYARNVRLGEERAAVLDEPTEKLLVKLDSLVAKSEDFKKKKEARIDQVRQNYLAANGVEKRYWLASEMYDEYCAYDSDSALYYIDRALEYAHQMGREDLEAEMLLNRSYVYSAIGLLEAAEECLEKMDPNKLPPGLAVKYCDRMLFLSTHRDQYMGVKRDTEVYSLMVDSLLQAMRRHIKPDNPQYCWLVGWSSLNDKKKAIEVIPIVSSIVDATDYTTRGNAMDAWVMSKLYDRVGDRQNQLKYLILSAMADVRASNKEIASLEELSQILYDLGDYDRANSYVNHCIAYANEYKSRVRLGELAGLQEKILGAIHDRSEQQIKANKVYLAVLVAILIVLICAIFYILRQNNQLKKSRQTLDKANSELEKRVVQLSAMHKELNEANGKLSEMYDKAAETARELSEVNETKEVSIANVFSVCAGYIDKLESYRANIAKLITSRKFDEALRLTKSPELSNTEIKDLCTTFDEIFLEMFPDFVNQFNSLLRDEERIELKTPGKLTTELRIYALVRLGMNENQRIAKFLHCSLQTVYNTRQRTRNKSRIPREQFAEAVMALGKKSDKHIS